MKFITKSKHALSILAFLLLISFLTFTASAGTVDFKMQYQDYLGLWHTYTDENLTQYPMYKITETDNNYSVFRINVTHDFERNSITSYKTYTDKIIPFYIFKNESELFKYRKGQSPIFFIETNWSASSIKSITDNEIDMDYLKRTVGIIATDNNGTIHNITASVAGNKIKFNLKDVNFSNISYPLTLTEQTITVTNATTVGWTSANVSLNGSAWSGKNGGSLRANLKNDSALNMSGLVAAWYFDSESGTLAQNVNTESGLINLTNRGTLVNMNTGLNNCTGDCSGWNSSGVIGNALAFDGVDDYVNAGNAASLNITNAITIEAWINSQNVYNSYQMLVTKSDGSASSSFELRFDSTTGKISYTSNMGGVYYNTGAIGQVLLNNTWYHIVSTYDNSTIRLYNNGIKYFSIAKSGVIYTSSDNLLIGSRASGTVYFFDGSIDEVRIYNRALSAAEIAVMYNTSLRITAMPLILNQTAQTGNVINRTRINYTGQDAWNNISLDATENGTSNWFIVQENITSDTWYDIANQYQKMDFRVRLNNNGSNTPFFTSLEWDERPPITIPANSWGMFNNWSENTNFSNIAANESNDVAFTFYNVTSGEWDSYYPGYSWNSGQVIDKNNSVMGFFNAETTITANIVTPWNTSITAGWNMLYLMGTSNQTLTAIYTNMVNCTDIYYYNSTTNDYVSTGTDTIQPNQGFLAYVNQTGTWIRSTI